MSTTGRGHTNHIGMLPYSSIQKRSKPNVRRPPYKPEAARIVNQQTQSNSKKKSFELMDITVSVVTLNGILMESKKKKEKRISDPSLRYCPSTDSEVGLPVTGVVSFSKNVTSNQTLIASHFPSLPLQPSGQHSNTTKERFIASWPKDYDARGNKLCTFKCSRMMRKESISDGFNSSSNQSMFVPERVRLSIGLTRGGEIINIGSSTLVVMGDESENVHMNLPVSLEKNISNEEENPGISLVRSQSSLFGKQPRKKATKNVKPVSFAKDPHRKYAMDQNACLKVLVSVRPSESSASTVHSPVQHNVLQYAASSSSIPGVIGSSGSGSGSRTGIRNCNDSGIGIGSESGFQSVIQSGSSRSSCESRNGSNSGDGSRSSNDNRVENRSNNFHIDHPQKFQPQKQNKKNWIPPSSYDDKSCSSMSDGEYQGAPITTLQQAFCGSFCTMITSLGMTECKNDHKKKGLKKPRRRNRKESSKKRLLDSHSIMPTHRNNDDNESHFLPPSKIYARSYSSDEEESGEQGQNYSLADSLFSDEESNYRQDYHSVATEKFNNTKNLKDMQVTRANYANRMGVNPETMI